MTAYQSQIKKIWSPIPNSSQALAIDTRCDETCFTGTRGPGKTDAQLARFRRRVGMGYGSFWKGVIFDQEYKGLDDIITKARRMFEGYGDGAQFKSSKADYKWVWPSGEELLFREFKDVKTYSKYHGQEFAFMGWNELTKWPTIDGYEMMKSCNRSSFIPEEHPIFIDKEYFYDAKRLVICEANAKNAMRYFLPKMPLEIFATTNSSGPGHNWVKSYFVKNGYGNVVRQTDEVFNPRTKQNDIITRSKVCIFGTWRENIYLDPKYIQALMSNRDPLLRRSWLLGDWDITIGGAFDDLWRRSKHVVPRFRIPKGWKIDRAFDWGSTHPFHCGWFAEANGEEVLTFNKFTGELRRFCPPKGTIIMFNEWYGAVPEQHGVRSNKGLKMSAKNVARGIKDMEIEMLQNGWISELPDPGPADNQIRDVVQEDVETIEKKMQAEDIYWEHSDKSPGSRRNGMQMVRDRLEAVITGEGPGLYFMDNCQSSIDTIPVLQRDVKKPDDVDTTQEDHPYDVVRYRCLASPITLVKNLNVSF